MVMPFYEGQTLIDWLRERNAPRRRSVAARLLAPLLDALELMHASHCYHRDIAPDNVLLLDPAQRAPRRSLTTMRRTRCCSTSAPRGV